MKDMVAKIANAYLLTAFNKPVEHPLIEIRSQLVTLSNIERPETKIQDLFGNLWSSNALKGFLRRASEMVFSLANSFQELPFPLGQRMTISWIGSHNMQIFFENISKQGGEHQWTNSPK